ncbi:hypothetical protein GCM10011515_08510 [Tsuneonella deserti]|uniref:Uncharacterized protein n=1 Tax=Tsuneonella deserti TaxID=2035528 RepID=A0ABQ1S5I2_9SPHN|nr:hypothetical protein GCM10011515_08510 [Tsuneonella deserti]
MKPKGNAGYGKMIADAVLASIDEPPLPAKHLSWPATWFEPGRARDRARRWLSMWLKGDLRDIPTEQAARYLEEMAEDLRAFGADKAVDRFVDKILPPLIRNGGPEDLAR